MEVLVFLAWLERGHLVTAMASFKIWLLGKHVTLQYQDLSYAKCSSKTLQQEETCLFSMETWHFVRFIEPGVRFGRALSTHQALFIISWLEAEYSFHWSVVTSWSPSEMGQAICCPFYYISLRYVGLQIVCNNWSKEGKWADQPMWWVCVMT